MITEPSPRGRLLIRSLLLFGLLVGWEASAMAWQGRDVPPSPTVRSVTSSGLAPGWEILRRAENPGGPPMELVEVQGVLEQAAVMTRPLSDGGGLVGEWFVRRDDRTTLAFAVESPPSPAPVGDTVVMRGVPAGQLLAVGRDGIERAWGLYTGRFVETRAEATVSTAFWGVAGGVLLMAIVWMMLVVRNRRPGRWDKGGLRSKSLPPDPDGMQGEQGLPGDAAAAMAMLAALHDGSRIPNRHDAEKDPTP